MSKSDEQAAEEYARCYFLLNPDVSITSYCNDDILETVFLAGVNYARASADVVWDEKVAEEAAIHWAQSPKPYEPQSIVRDWRNGAKWQFSRDKLKLQQAEEKAEAMRYIIEKQQHTISAMDAKLLDKGISFDFSSRGGE